MEKQKTVAVIGASNDRRKYSNKAVRAYILRGFKVYPVNPNEDTVEGLKAYKSILDIPDEIDRATFYVLPKVGIKIIEEVAKKGVKELYLNPGTESDELVDKAKKLGLNPILACSILAVGLDPKEVDELKVEI
ncbi:TPA: CoA-binding protein [Candidatus Poribacteria bacterium]|nr:CoA-binding protein [Candidatus Poribacteria bacterium]